MSTTPQPNVPASLVRELRDKTGAPMMDCKNALVASAGDLEKAVEWLRKRGTAVMEKKSSRTTKEGAVESYIHAGGKIGVLVEVNCESDFVARTPDFKELVHDIAMHIAASDPTFIRKEDVTPEAYEKEKDIYRAQAASTGKPPNVVEKIVEGKMSKFYEEVCLYEQPFIKEHQRRPAYCYQDREIGREHRRAPLCPLQGRRSQRQYRFQQGGKRRRRQRRGLTKREVCSGRLRRRRIRVSS